MNKIKKLLLLILALHSALSLAQVKGIDQFEQFDSVGGDIFTDFSEDVEAGTVLEGERFYKYGRYFSFQIGVGVTSFTDNRGIAYEDAPPSVGLGFLYFFNFKMAFTMGLALSKHNFFLNDAVNAFDAGPAGQVEVTMFRVFAGIRYYIDTTDLGTALTYSNPYFAGRIEYWLQTNKFVDQSGVANQSGGAFGTSVGGGLEFPVDLKDSFVNVEILYHVVNFFDKFTTDYRPIEDTGSGFDDMDGDVYTVMVSYVLSW